jgi:hypothetical protein
MIIATKRLLGVDSFILRKSVLCFQIFPVGERLQCVPEINKKPLLYDASIALRPMEGHCLASVIEVWDLYFKLMK